METYYCIIRTIEPSECHWLNEIVDAGTIVQRFTGVTYGCISPTGTAVLFEPNGTFCEIPKDALLQIANAETWLW